MKRVEAKVAVQGDGLSKETAQAIAEAVARLPTRNIQRGVQSVEMRLAKLGADVFGRQRGGIAK